MSSSRRPQQYFTPKEVARHNVEDDVWLSVFGRVLDLTKLIAERRRQGEGALVRPLLRFAGEDVTHWFDESTRAPRSHVDPASGKRKPFLPHGAFVDSHLVPPRVRLPEKDHLEADEEATANNEKSAEVKEEQDECTPWWMDESLCVGLLSARTREIRIVNTLTAQEDVLEVCAEETLAEIRRRYMRYNAHATSYTFKRLGRPLDMRKTLEGNGLPDESDEMQLLLGDRKSYVPSLHLYFNDDLTVA